MGHTRIARAQDNNRSIAETGTKDSAIGIKSDNSRWVALVAHRIAGGKNFRDALPFSGVSRGAADRRSLQIQAPAERADCSSYLQNFGMRPVYG